MSSDFNGLLERLVEVGVDFVVVGGFAGVVHGCTYVTQDIDGIGGYQEVKNACITVEVGQMQLRVMNVDALIKAKKAMNRPRDREALVQLETLKELKRQ